MTRSAKSQLFRTPPNGNLGHSFNGPSDPNEVLVPGMNNLDALGEMFVNGRTAVRSLSSELSD